MSGSYGPHTTNQVDEAQAIAPIVGVQNVYNVGHRHDDELVASLAADGIAYVPFFPLGGFRPCDLRPSRPSLRACSRHREQSPSPGS